MHRPRLAGPRATQRTLEPLHQDLTQLFPMLGPCSAELTLVWMGLCTNTAFWIKSILGVLKTATCPAPMFPSCSPLLFP